MGALLIWRHAFAGRQGRSCPTQYNLHACNGCACRACLRRWIEEKHFQAIWRLHSNSRIVWPGDFFPYDCGILPNITDGDLMSGDGDEDLLALAAKADRAAMVAQGQIAKQYWQGVAKEYRALAAGKLKPGRSATADGADVLMGSPQSLRGPQDPEQRSAAKWYRLYLKDRVGETVGRADFEIPDDADPLIIAKTVLDACSDVACGYELWARDKFVDSSTEPLKPSDHLSDLQGNYRKIIVATEMSLRDSVWLVSRSKKLLEEIEKFTRG